LGSCTPRSTETQVLWQTDIGMHQKRADTYSARPCRPRPGLLPIGRRVLGLASSSTGPVGEISVRKSPSGTRTPFLDRETKR
jgi:hypothetical protein